MKDKYIAELVMSVIKKEPLALIEVSALMNLPIAGS